eukprot:TRINITY_DN19887_c0_g1_i1.p1 TRINITY_DN19887_c0_g1~~TRINITY_DN19887_c0_g1_i1.p1  ORF type:complete len:319 (+),score=68.74 TRINITY_DN19887_c0_g1_i1:171-1127(+)
MELGSLLQPSRSFIKQGPLGVYDLDPNGSTLQVEDLKQIDSLRNFNARYVFLFTDLILTTKHSEMERKNNRLSTVPHFVHSLQDLVEDPLLQFRFMDHIILAECNLPTLELIDISPTLSSTLLNFHLFALKKRSDYLVYVFATLDQQSKNDWVREIDLALWNLIKNKRMHLKFDIQQEEQISVKGNKATSGYLYINYDGIPGTWIRRFVVCHGSKLFFCTHEQEYCENKISSYLHTLDIVNIFLWPIPNTIDFMDYEEIHTKKRRQHCFVIQKPNHEKTLRHIYFSAESAECKMSWINDIRASVRVHLEDIERRSTQN